MTKYLVLLALVACKDHKKSGRVEETPGTESKPTTDPACAAKAKELKPWLEQLAAEEATNEINMGWTPVQLDRAPAKVTHEADYAMVSATKIAAWDASESNHVGGEIEPAKLAESVGALFAKTGSEAGDDVLRVDVDAAAPWSQVAALSEAAAGAGYTKIIFAFEGTSKVAPPPGVPATTDSEKAFDEADKRLGELRAACSLGHSPSSIAEGLERCNCKVDPDEVRAVMWKTSKWHQAHSRVGVELAIAKDGKPIEQPAATPWSEAHEAVLDQKDPVKLVATK